MSRLTHSRKAFKGALSALLLCGVLSGSALAENGEGGVILDIREGEAPAVCSVDAPQVRVTVSGQYATGILTVELYNDDTRNFLSREGRIKRVRVPATDGEQVICFDIEGAGTYAVAGYHDIDADRELDKKWNRLPKEPFGLSNDPKLKLRKPRHREAAFEAGDLGTDIELRIYNR